ncbi:MAG: TerC family protein [Rhodospirillaceae bacterium]|nr:TerC family protein [Rhodospirillaceae bacterium]
MTWIADPDVWLSLLTLTALEIVLGIDNLVFIAVLVEKLPHNRRTVARRAGIALALITRLLLLSMIFWIVGLTRPVLGVFGLDLSWRDIILIAGGLFLLYKGTREIHDRIEGDEGHGPSGGGAGFWPVVLQIGILDIVFSLDSVITAVGMADHLWIMATAVIIAVFIMLGASGPVSAFIGRHPTIKMLAFSFLLLIGMVLVADGLGFHIPKGYVYAAMGFSVMVESLNLLAQRRTRQRDRVRSQETAHGRAPEND